ncbi:hypothetical protein [Clostridium polynesiense]|uniref:hypothetical protein n=1 Tax=Clostridium polynesiense TaxID=1325933 RepID=UPI00059006A5|nr:hypothetical protein [Clostridium polynesiense]
MNNYIGFLCLIIAFISFAITFIYPDKWFNHRRNSYKGIRDWNKYFKEFKSTMEFIQIYCLSVGLFLLIENKSNYAAILVLPVVFSIFIFINIKNKYSV